MANLKLTLPENIVICDGKQITFKAPCNCSDVTSLTIKDVSYELKNSKNETPKDAWIQGALVSIVLDTTNNVAYLLSTGSSSTTHMTKVYLTSSAWDADTKTQTVSVEGILADETKQSIEVSPYNKEHTDLVTKYGIYCSGQGEGTLTFTAESIPESMVIFSVEWKDVSYQSPSVSGISTTLADNSWANISMVSKLGLAKEYWDIGDTIPVDINGISYDFQIIGFDHDNVSDSATYGRAKAGITFQMVQADNMGLGEMCYNLGNTNVGGWESSEMRTIHLPTIKSVLPDELTENIVHVNKLTSEGNKSSTIVTTEDNLFLLSEIEIFGTTTYSAMGEGIQYSYYANGGSTDKNLLWWERSPHIGTSTAVCSVYGDGSTFATHSHDQSVSLSFAFCV